MFSIVTLLFGDSTKEKLIWGLSWQSIIVHELDEYWPIVCTQIISYCLRHLSAEAGSNYHKLLLSLWSLSRLLIDAPLFLFFLAFLLWALFLDWLFGLFWSLLSEFASADTWRPELLCREESSSGDLHTCLSTVLRQILHFT